MKEEPYQNSIELMVSEHDRKNLAAIARAEEQGKINAEARQYLESLYTDGGRWFHEIFQVLGKCFGAPKAAVMPYDLVTGQVEDRPIQIADINPLSAYMVYHRLDADPMRNQFFTLKDNHRVELSVASIVNVIVGAQKSINRTLEKVTGKYYEDYVNDVANATAKVLEANDRAASARAIAEKIHEKFGEKFITNASETVLKIIGGGHEKIAVDLVRELDKVTKPHLRLRDVWRVKCLFDLVPQIRTFIERIREMDPERVIEVRDKYYNTNHPRNYRDAKIILNIGNGTIIPMEIICQVRTFFDFERQGHTDYEAARKKKNAKTEDIEKRLAEFREDGIRKYNTMICTCLDDLFDRVGWNILYSDRAGESQFDGFPKISKIYYPQKVIDNIMDKLENGVENEVFRVMTAPRKLSIVEEMDIFRYLAKFVLVSAVPYQNWDWKVPGDGQAEKLFNFIMNELRRYYVN